MIIARVPPLALDASPQCRALILSALLITSSALKAQEAGGGPCSADYRRLCTGVKPRGGRIVSCLKSHEAVLTVSCRAALWKQSLPGRER